MKLAALAVSLSMIASAPALAAETGFTAGNDLRTMPIRGEVSVSCSENGMSEFAHFICEDTLLDPAEYSYFVTTPGGDADSVTLTATWPNGKTVSKTERYDASKGKSDGSFNLWIETLFQRPLLTMGANRVHYSLTRDGTVRSEGDFTATIQPGELRTCRRGHVTSFRMDDCRFGNSACNQYFRQENYCQD